MRIPAFKWVLGLLVAAGVPALGSPMDEPIKPLPLTLKQDPARAEIGRLLFHDTRLSANGKVACVSCHDTSKGGSDGRDRSVGFAGALTGVHAPTVFNAAFNFKQFWNGRADSLEGQVDLVVQNPVEMGSRWEDVVAKVSADTKYRAAFAEAYPQGVTAANIRHAIATYERTLITPNSRFDRYLRGDASAITTNEREGYARFKRYGCVACHQGVNVGGNMFQRFGVMGDYFARRGNITPADLGRYEVTRDDGDRYVFKVPSLRNVALRPPYFHDASAKTLDDAVDVMFRYQLGRVATKQDKALIIEFLRSLNGELEGKP